MDRPLEDMLGERGPLDADDEARKQFEAARDLTRWYENGDPYAGDLAEAINGYRLLFDELTADREEERRVR